MALAASWFIVLQVSMQVHWIQDESIWLLFFNISPQYVKALMQWNPPEASLNNKSVLLRVDDFNVICMQQITHRWTGVLLIPFKVHTVSLSTCICIMTLDFILRMDLLIRHESELSIPDIMWLSKHHLQSKSLYPLHYAANMHANYAMTLDERSISPYHCNEFPPKASPAWDHNYIQAWIPM